MIIEKGNYKFIRAAVCKSSIMDKETPIPLRSLDSKEVIGKVIIEDENPLTLNLTIDKKIELNSNYFTIIPMNYTTQNGYIIKVMSFKLSTSFDEYVPYIMDENTLVKKTRKKTNK